ncbi:MAG TPA: DNA repair protein RadC [Allosphingosinicella sp.]|nr:DNA repair protein RadC [Allosphingosinicella sp.]
MADVGFDASGHRGRLRQRLFEGGPRALHDHELIEYLIGLALPRRDTKPLARRLIAEFGGIAELLSADPLAIVRRGKVTEGVAAAIKIAHALSLRRLEQEVKGGKVLASWQALEDYLRTDMAAIRIERVRALLLNTKNVLIRDELLSEGSVDEAAVYVREIIRKAIDHHASALILVHNHPSGDPQPSQQDIRLTREIVDAARPLNIVVHDHVIVGGHKCVSMRGLGLI